MAKGLGALRADDSAFGCRHAHQVMQYLPWVLGSGANMDPGDNLGLKVMCARTLPVAEALKLLEGRHAHLRWRYLLHAVRRQGDQA